MEAMSVTVHEGVVYELCEFVVPVGRELEFEDAMATARKVIARCDGLISIEYWRGVESTNVYTLLLKWRSMDAHLEEWRNSPHYSEWAELVVPFISEPPRPLRRSVPWLRGGPAGAVRTQFTVGASRNLPVRKTARRTQNLPLRGRIYARRVTRVE
jgi:heme-degrading monooxygenase HmoA